jgi:tRNA A-37 threonylcarbamoyl transferase component Bud32
LAHGEEVGAVGRLHHGYTNLTRRIPGERVEKRYEGAGRFERAEREHACLVRLAGRVPVPEVVGRDPAVPLLVVREVPGVHGQDMIDAGRAAEVLRLLGSTMARLQQLPVGLVPGLAGTGPVIVHGDFGPQNVLIDDGEDGDNGKGGRVSALLDWEFAHVGEPVEDLAWAEWIVRMHHPAAVDAISELLDASGLAVGWSARHRTMVTRCEDLLRSSEVGRSPDAIALWRRRLRSTERWEE